MTNCETFGHVAPVPMPSVGGAADYVVRFLRLVHELVEFGDFDPSEWQHFLMTKLGGWQADEEERPLSDKSAMENMLVLRCLRDSLAHGEPMCW